MKIIRDIKNTNFNTPIVASIGAFDGVHLGHQKIINKVKILLDELFAEDAKMKLIG